MPRNLTREDREFLIELVSISLDSTGDLADADSITRVTALSFAEQFIEWCGFDLKDSDQLGFEMGEFVQKRLAEAFLMIGLDGIRQAMDS